MTKLALVFPGQGAQYIGMGKFLYDNYQVAQDTFHQAGLALGYDIKEKIFLGSKEELRKTELTQPAILTTSVASARVLKELGFSPQGACGLSLGEYSALVLADAIPFEQALTVVEKRGRLMQEAVPEGKGKMVSVLGLSSEQVEKACDAVREESDQYVVPANYNSPKQLVISGEVQAVDMAQKKCQELGAKKTKELSVSAPFHCDLLKPAADKLSNELEKVELKTPELTVISNVTGEPFDSKAKVKENLVKQVMSPVLLHQSFNKLLNLQFDSFIDVGPGKTMSKLLKKVDRKVFQTSLDSEDDLQSLISKKEDLIYG